MPDSSIIELLNQPIITNPEGPDECNKDGYVDRPFMAGANDDVMHQFRQQPCTGNLVCDLTESENEDTETEIYNEDFTSDPTGAYTYSGDSSKIHWGTISGDGVLEWYDLSGSASGAAVIIPAAPFVPGRQYRVQFNLSAYASGIINVGGTFDGANNHTITTPAIGNYDFILDCDTAGEFFMDVSQTGGNYAVIISNLIISEIVTVNSNDCIGELPPDWYIDENGLTHIAGADNPINWESSDLINAQYYKVEIEATLTEGATGSLEINIFGNTQTFVPSQFPFKLSGYYTNNAPYNITFTPDADWDGVITKFTVVQYNNVFNMLLINKETDQEIDLVNKTILEEDFVTVKFKPSDLDLEDGCYYIRYENPCIFGNNLLNNAEFDNAANPTTDWNPSVLTYVTITGGKYIVDIPGGTPPGTQGFLGQYILPASIVPENGDRFLISIKIDAITNIQVTRTVYGDLSTSSILTTGVDEHEIEVANPATYNFTLGYTLIDPDSDGYLEIDWIKVQKVGADIIYRTNNIKVVNSEEDLKCTKLITGYNEDCGFGFNFQTFRLVQRISFLKFNPKYPMKQSVRLSTDGIRSRGYAERSKTWECLVDHVDEVALDALTTQLLCDNLLIDGKAFFYDDNGVSAKWEKDGTDNITQAEFELYKQSQPTIFSNKC